MSLRWKIALALAALASIATVSIGAASYRAARDRLFAEVDRSLTQIDAQVNDRRLGRDSLPVSGPLSGFFAQVIRRDGVIVETTFPSPLPVTDEALAIVGRPRAASFSTVTLDDGTYRVRTIGLPRSALQVGRSLDETERVLRSLRARLLFWVLVMAAAAIAVGFWISGRVTASLRRLTLAAEQVEATGRLDVAIDEGGSDEVGRLGHAFDRMLAALARSKDDQHRLVQDAGHELRTPLTSLRTNLDTLQRFPGLPETDRAAIIADLHAETEELTDLVNEIITVASGDVVDEPFQTSDLVVLVEATAERFRRRTGRPIVVTTGGRTPPLAMQQAAVQRAVSCLLDNACKFDRSDGPIDVTVAGNSVLVADRGPGVPSDEITHIFDRFHRAETSRSMPGSGLGLSIVRDVARGHGGDVVARERAGGGAEVGFRLGA